MKANTITNHNEWTEVDDLLVQERLLQVRRQRDLAQRVTEADVLRAHALGVALEGGRHGH